MKITCEDNMDLMRRYKDNYFDLAIVDPPYGVNIEKNQKAYHEKKIISNGGKWKKYDVKGWDSKTPTKEYFTQLKRVSKNQIIWGGNYFLDYLGNTKCFLIWDKIQRTYLADGEIAWTSLDKPTKVFRFSKIDAYVNELKKTKDTKIHPTQKPVKLYEWLLHNYAKKGYKILDTHLGSGSIAIACHNLGYNLTACEIDKDYFNLAIQRIKKHKAQKRLL